MKIFLADLDESVFCGGSCSEIDFFGSRCSGFILCGYNNFGDAGLVQRETYVPGRISGGFYGFRGRGEILGEGLVVEAGKRNGLAGGGRDVCVDGDLRRIEWIAIGRDEVDFDFDAAVDGDGCCVGRRTDDLDRTRKLGRRFFCALGKCGGRQEYLHYKGSCYECSPG